VTGERDKDLMELCDGGVANDGKEEDDVKKCELEMGKVEDWDRKELTPAPLP